MWAIIIRAFVDRDLFTDFPDKEGMIAIGAIVFGFRVFRESLV